MLALFTKADNKGYVRKDGTLVKPFDDNRMAFLPKPAPVAKPEPVAKRGSLFFGASGAPFKIPSNVPRPQPKAYHPKPGDHGERVGIHEPMLAGKNDFKDPKAVLVFTPGEKCPKALNGVALDLWTDAPKTVAGWDYVDGQMDDLDEPVFKLKAGQNAASGCIIEESDGRIWLVHPTNRFAGYKATFPKGGAEEELSLQANAIKECFEESGLKVEITGFFGDFDRGLSRARYYTARRVGGTPSDMGWESQAVSLVPREHLLEHLNGPSDLPVAIKAGARAPEVSGADKADDWEKIGGQKGSNPGGFYETPDGVEWYCKFPQSEDHARNEVLAARLYQALGILVPEIKLITQGGKVGVASKFIDCLVRDPEGLKAGEVSGVREGFAADAWLGNYDVVGLVFDNLLVDGQGRGVRLDPGGALLYRDQGKPKGDGFGDTVGEIDSMQDLAKNRSAAEVFGQVTDDEIRAGVERIQGLGDDLIHALVSRFGPGDDAQKVELADRLIARKKDLVARFG